MALLPHTACPNLDHVTIHRASPTRRNALLFAIVVLYCIALPWAYSTMGHPLERAMVENERLQSKTQVDKTALFIETATTEAVATWDDEETTTGGVVPPKVVSTSSSSIVSNTPPATTTTTCTGDEETCSNNNNNTTTTTTTANTTTTSTDTERPLPSPFLPDAIPLLFVLSTMSIHALFFLLCRWSTTFLVRTLYEPQTQVDTTGNTTTFLYICPKSHRGKEALCPLHLNPKTGNLNTSFQRQTYEYLPSTQISILEAQHLIDFKHYQENEPQMRQVASHMGALRLVVTLVNQPISEYKAAGGILTQHDVEVARALYGRNTVSVPQPPFLELLKAQMLMPLSIFQLFSCALWAIDEYIQYTIFTLFTIVLMESTTAMQRHRTMAQLQGLQPQPFVVKVYRCDTWSSTSSDDLLPGDIIVLRSGCVVPCDCVILGGSAIVNEATLTGESVPQMKDSLDSVTDPGKTLDVDGADRVRVLFSGTTLVATSPPVKPPNTVLEREWQTIKSDLNGCICHVLRTGYGSSQGELMQLIEFSQQAVSADSKETGLALFILVLFALASATMVVRKGLERGDRTTHELLLKAIIIITSVVPRQLPVQMALAVNQALMALSKEGIFCTEPFRVPQAGKITHVLFDKTGTLTSDELVPAGVVNHTTNSSGELVAMTEASTEASIVLSSCHSLVALPDNPSVLLGDPIEVAAVKGLQFKYDATNNIATPGDATSKERALADVMKRMQDAGPNEILIATLRKEEAFLRESMKQVLERSEKNPIECIRILKRFHFEAALQRMSVVASVQYKTGNKAPVLMSCVKGSPEAISKCLKSVPSWYFDRYQTLAERGMRVLALAIKPLTSSETKLTRESAEKDLDFCGFVAFECKIRADSPAVVSSLCDAAIVPCMLTGDAPLTALFVADVCGFLQKNKGALILDKTGRKWQGANAATRHVTFVDVHNTPDMMIPQLHREGWDLVVTEDGLEYLFDRGEEIASECLCHIPVFARMSPRGKARVIATIQKAFRGKPQEKFVLMCGDGGNDVGALKQADVGLALLSGFGSANTNNNNVVAVTTTTTPTTTDAIGKTEEDKLNEQVEMQKKTMAHLHRLKAEELKVKTKEIQSKQKEWMEEALQQATQQGFMAQMGAVKTVAVRVKTEIQKESMLLDRKYGLTGTGESTGTTSLSEEALDGALPQIRPGDASVAAAFTSRIPSVRSVIHLIRQGRCTLLASLQSQQTMILDSTISAYTYAMISLEGSRSSERQMMISGWLIMTAAMSFTYASPIDKMHRVKPIRSLFHPAVVVSLVGQAFILLYSMSFAVKLATDAMGPEKLAEVVAFNKRVSAGTAENVEEEDDPLKLLQAIWSKPFLPNLMNTTVFLVETSQIMAVFLANYRGIPFMRGILQNHALFLSLFICIFGVAALAWEVVPQANRAIHLHAFPNDEYRFTVLGLVCLNFLGTFVWDRISTALFAREIFMAMVDSAKKTTLFELVPIVSSLIKTILGFGLFATGNPVIWFAAWWAYRKFIKGPMEAQEARMLLLGREKDGGGSGRV